MTISPISKLKFDPIFLQFIVTLSAHLVSQPPGRPDALLDVLDEAVTALEARVVVQRGPDLAAHLLQQKVYYLHQLFLKSKIRNEKMKVVCISFV